jgi:phytoene synthase
VPLAPAAATDEAQAALLEEAYEACRYITEQYAKTFYMGTKFFSPEKQRAVCAVYAWCRRTDDIVDKPRKDMSSLRTELADWRRRTQGIWEGKSYDMIDLALIDTVKNYPSLSIEPFEDMIKGMVMDLDQNRFETFDELYLYCYRVAGTVGLMMMPIMGTAEGYTYEEALEPALALGVALQLTNILRDVGEDRARQRIYLPQEELRKFGVTEASLLKGMKTDKYVQLVKWQIDRARDWYRKAESGIPMLAPDAQLPIRASLEMYSKILNKIEANNYDNLTKRAYTTKAEKLAMIPGAWLKVQTYKNAKKEE